MADVAQSLVEVIPFVGEKLAALIDVAKGIKEMCDNAKHAKKLSKELGARIGHCVSMIEFFQQFIASRKDQITESNINSLKSVAESLTTHMTEAREEIAKYKKCRGIRAYRRYTRGGAIKDDMKETLDMLLADISILSDVVQMWELAHKQGANHPLDGKTRDEIMAQKTGDEREVVVEKETVAEGVSSCAGFNTCRDEL